MEILIFVINLVYLYHPFTDNILKWNIGSEYTREIATFDKVTSTPLLKDPYESKMVQSLPSKVPGANEGLFAKVKIEPNTTLAFYNGKRLHPKSKDNYDHPDWEKV